MNHKAGLDVGSLVLVDCVALGELVEHLLHFGQEFDGSCLVGRGAELAHSVTHSFSVVSVVQSASSRLTDSLYR